MEKDTPNELNSIEEHIDFAHRSLSLETADLKQVTDLETFALYTENYIPHGQIWYNQQNIILTTENDYKTLINYAVGKEILQINMPEFKSGIWVISHISSKVLRRAIKIES